MIQNDLTQRPQFDAPNWERREWLIQNIQKNNTTPLVIIMTLLLFGGEVGFLLHMILRAQGVCW